MACLAHFGQWGHPARRRERGPLPKPRWCPVPELLYAQGVQSSRRRRIVGSKSRVVFGTGERGQQALSAGGRKSNPACVERLNLEIRQRVAAVGRRVNTLCQGADGLQQQLVLCQTSHHCVLPHARWRQPLLVPEPTKGDSQRPARTQKTPVVARRGTRARA
jgi:hypothetical protein